MFHIIHNFCISNHLFPLLTQALSNLWSLYFLFLFFAGAWGRCFAFKLFGLGFREPSVQQRDCAGLQQKKRSRSHTQTPFDFSSALLIPSLLSLLRKKKKTAFSGRLRCVSLTWLFFQFQLFFTHSFRSSEKKGKWGEPRPSLITWLLMTSKNFVGTVVFFVCC